MHKRNRGPTEVEHRHTSGGLQARLWAFLVSDTTTQLMAKSKDQKVAILERLNDALKNSQSAVFVNFHGLSVSDESEMRSALKEQGVSYFVAKKTLVKRALSESGFTGEVPPLDGELAVAYGDDAVAPAREVYAFTKKYKDALSILGGVFEGEVKDKVSMEAIATIPSLQTLYGQFVGLLNSPLSGFVVVLNQIAEKKEV